MGASCFVMATDADIVPSADVVSSIKLPHQYEIITEQIQAKIDSEVAQRVSEQRELIDNDALVAVVKISETLQLLAAGNKDAAIKALDEARDKLNEIIKKQQKVQSEPVMIVNLVNDYLINYDEIQRRKQEIHLQWEHGHTQKVRRLLNNFVSDVTIRTLSIPVQYFADGTKQAKQLISESKITKAKYLIEMLLKSIELSDYTIPLPLFRAELMVTEAEQLTQQVSSQPVDVDQLYLLMSNAKYQLKTGEALGYGDPKRYAKFYQAIEGIKSLVNAKQQTTKLFSKLRYAILNLKNEVIELK